MKNIQVIDNTVNCAYDIYSVSDNDFFIIFPDGKDIEFSEDFFERLGDTNAQKILEPMWNNRVNKKHVDGIHGTLFYGFRDEKKHVYPNKKEADLDIFCDG